MVMADAPSSVTADRTALELYVISSYHDEPWNKVNAVAAVLDQFQHSGLIEKVEGSYLPTRKGRWDRERLNQLWATGVPDEQLEETGWLRQEPDYPVLTESGNALAGITDIVAHDYGIKPQNSDSEQPQSLTYLERRGNDIIFTEKGLSRLESLNVTDTLTSEVYIRQYGNHLVLTEKGKALEEMYAVNRSGVYTMDANTENFVGIKPYELKLFDRMTRLNSDGSFRVSGEALIYGVERFDKVKMMDEMGFLAPTQLGGVSTVGFLGYSPHNDMSDQAMDELSIMMDDIEAASETGTLEGRLRMMANVFSGFDEKSDFYDFVESSVPDFKARYATKATILASLAVMAMLLALPGMILP